MFDISEGMVKAARAFVDGLHRWADVEVSIADGVALPLSDSSVDTVIAVHMLYHLADPAAGLREMARITRPGGILSPSF